MISNKCHHHHHQSLNREGRWGTTKLRAKPVECLLEVCEDMVEVLLVLEIFLTENG